MTVLFVILTIAFFLVLDWYLHRGKETATAPARARTATVRTPSGVFFAPSHTWVNLFPSGRTWLGVDDFVVRLLREPRVQYFKHAGDRISKGEPVLALEDGAHRLIVKSPLDARIVHVNHELSRGTGLTAGAAFDEGWALELEPEKPAEIKSLLLGEESKRWMADEFRRLRDLFAAPNAAVSPAMLQDGGTPVQGALRCADAETWTRFEREFLEVR